MADRYTPERRREYMRDYYARRSREAKTLLGGECANCGSREDLQFDHIEPLYKKHNITDMLMWAKKKWLEELEKCQLLCRQHHKEKTERHIADGTIRMGPKGMARLPDWRRAQS